MRLIGVETAQSGWDLSKVWGWMSYIFSIKQRFRKIIEIVWGFQWIIPKSETAVLAAAGLGYNRELFWRLRVNYGQNL